MLLTPSKHTMACVRAICTAAALNGLLSGCDSPVISGALDSIIRHSPLSAADPGAL